MSAPAPERRSSAEEYGTYGADYRFAPIEETRDPGLCQLWKCWNEVKGERAMPTRPELNPFKLRALLRITQMFDVVDGGHDFRVRVMGSGIVEQTGLQVTGKCISEFGNPQLIARMMTSLRRVVETRAPVRMIAERSAVRQVSHKRPEVIYLPLGDNEPTHILSGVTFHGRGLLG